VSTPLPARFAENVHRLALGIEPIDQGRGARVAHPLDVRIEGHRAAVVGARVSRRPSCLHALLYRPGLGTHAEIRLSERARRFVPRRLRVPLPDLGAGGDPPIAHRTRRVSLFPGAAYDAAGTTTGLRGRVVRGGQPMRWARVVAVRPGTNVVVGRAFGDDRGDFLLLLGSEAMPIGDLVNPLPIEVTVFGPAVPLPPFPAADQAHDPLWGLPLEEVPAPGLPDTVTTGETLPTGYSASVSQVVGFRPGRMLSDEVSEFVIP